MDPVTHTFVGGSLAAAGLRRTTTLATPTLILAVNAPDIDIAAMAWGPFTALAWRRGITHGIPALVVLPFLVVGVVLLWHRIRKRAGAPHAPPRPGILLGLAALGVATHPLLDWVNTYGMRWLVPFEGAWSYGDSIFIVDPWLWLLLGGPAFLASSAGIPARLPWGVLAVALSLPMLLLDIVPVAARLAWIGGIGTWLALRAWAGSTHGPRVERVAGVAIGIAVLYGAGMVGQTFASERVVLAEAERDDRIGTVVDLMVGPAPANPLAGEVVIVTADAYWTGRFHWSRTPRVAWDPEPLPRPARTEVVRAAETHPDARDYLVWARFPVYRIEAREEGWRVEIRDARYREGGGALGGVDIIVGSDLRPRRARQPRRADPADLPPAH